VRTWTHRYYLVMLLVVLLLPLGAAGSGSEGKAGRVSHEVGLSASSISGIGLSYGINSEPWGGRATGFLVYDSDSEHLEHLKWNLGGELQRDLQHDPSARLYLLVGANLWYDRDERTHLVSYLDDPDPFANDSERVLVHEVWTDKYLVFGAGVGMSWTFLEHLSLHVEIGAEHRDKVNGAGVTRIGVAGGAGLAYRL